MVFSGLRLTLSPRIPGLRSRDLTTKDHPTRYPGCTTALVMVQPGRPAEIAVKPAGNSGYPQSKERGALLCFFGLGGTGRLRAPHCTVVRCAWVQRGVPWVCTGRCTPGCGTRVVHPTDLVIFTEPEKNSEKLRPGRRGRRKAEKLRKGETERRHDDVGGTPTLPHAFQRFQRFLRFLCFLLFCVFL